MATWYKSRFLMTAALTLTLVLGACGKKEEAAEQSQPEPATKTAEAPAAPTCGKVSIASMNWQSAEVLAEIDKVILSKGYDCDVEIVPGDTQPTLTSMLEKGVPDVAPESWIDAMRVPLDRATAEGRLHYASKVLSDGGEQGIWIPKYIADANPDIKTIADALARPDLFPSPEDSDKGALYNCPAGWNCQTSTDNAFTAWNGTANNFVLVDSGSAAGLDGSIAKAYERQQGWLGYYWAPTSILGKYPMVRLAADVPFNKEIWDNCNSKECAEPQKNDWPVAEVYTVVTDRFKKAGGPAYAYLERRAWGNETVNTLLAWMLDNQATGEDAAVYFLQNNENVWSSWVSPDVAAKVKASL